jgi:hypothetical protein
MKEDGSVRTVVGVGVAGAPGVDVVAGLDLRPLHPLRQQPHRCRPCRSKLPCREEMEVTVSRTS